MFLYNKRNIFQYMQRFHMRHYYKVWVVGFLYACSDRRKLVYKNWDDCSWQTHILLGIPGSSHDIVSNKIWGDYICGWSKCASYFPFVMLVKVNDLYYKLQYIRGYKLVKYAEIILRNLDRCYIFWNFSIHVADSNEYNPIGQIYTSFCIDGYVNPVCVVFVSKILWIQNHNYGLCV